MELLREAITNTRPSLDVAELHKYEQIRNEMNGEQTPSKKRPRVGL